MNPANPDCVQLRGQFDQPQSAPPRLGIRTLSVSPKSLQRFNTSFGTAKAPGFEPGTYGSKSPANNHGVFRPIKKFHTPDALRELLSRKLSKGCEWLAQNLDFPKGFRPYQQKANRAAEVAIGEQKRRLLLAMATGTGKTFTTVNQCYRLLKSGTAKRILFLVDRRALAAQAVRAFAEFEPEPNPFGDLSRRLEDFGVSSPCFCGL